jgi:aminoglycoside 3-N-acetyltransferase
VSEADAVRAAELGRGPATVGSLAADLAALGVRPGRGVVVHSALRRFGWVCGGALAVVQALQRAVAPGGTLMMPAHTGLSDPAEWRHPPVPEAWWDTIRATMPAYEPAVTPTRQMGAIVECFRTVPGARRSAHPQLSFVAWGPAAQELTAEHPLDHGLGEGSPLARLYDLDGDVLLVGVDHGNNTSLHLAEYRARFAGKREVRQGAPVLGDDGERDWAWYHELAVDESDFAALGEEFDATGAVRIGPVGNGVGRLMRQRELIAFAIPWLEAHRR